MKALLKVAAFILTFAAAIWLIDFVIGSVLHKDANLLLHHGIGQIVFYLLFILNVYIFQTYVNKQSFLSLGIKPYPGWLSTFLKGWAAGVFAFVFFTILQDQFGAIDLQNRWGFERVITAFFVAFSAFAIAATEEILFRGFFLQTLLKGLPKWSAVILTGILFVLFHDLANMQNFWMVPKYRMLAAGLFCLNLLLCCAYLKTGSLYLPMAIHSGLVFGKVFFRKMKLAVLTDPTSILWGSDGDARRGVMAWVLFLSGIFVLQFLITKSNEQKNSF